MDAKEDEEKTVLRIFQNIYKTGNTRANSQWQVTTMGVCFFSFNNITTINTRIYVFFLQPSFLSIIKLVCHTQSAARCITALGRRGTPPPGSSEEKSQRSKIETKITESCLRFAAALCITRLPI